MEHQARPEPVHIGGDRSPIPQMLTPMPSNTYTFPDKPSVGRVACPGQHADAVSGIAHRMHAAEHYQFRISATCVILTVVNLYVLLERLGLKKMNLILQLGAAAVVLRALPAVCCAYMCWTRLPDSPRASVDRRSSSENGNEDREERRGDFFAGGALRFSRQAGATVQPRQPEHRLLLKHLSPEGLEIVLESERRHRRFSLWAIAALLLLAASDACQGYTDMWPFLHLEKDKILAQASERPPLFGPPPPGVAREGFAVYPPEPKPSSSFLAVVAEQVALVLAHLLRAAAAFCLLKSAHVQCEAGNARKRQETSENTRHSTTATRAADRGSEPNFQRPPSRRIRPAWWPSRPFYLQAVLQSPFYVLCYLILVRWTSLPPSPRPRLFRSVLLETAVATAGIDWTLRLTTVVTLCALAQGLSCCACRVLMNSLSSETEQEKQPVFVRTPSKVLLFLGVSLLLFSVAAGALTAFLPYAAGLEDVSYIWWMLRRASIEERIATCAGVAAHFLGSFLVGCAATSFGLQNHLVSRALRGDVIHDAELNRASEANPPTLLVGGKPAFLAEEKAAARAKAD
ncbi:conserved hypothetical protein [Neospora caninum Liverpool]|uniref:Transmembrane protein n=1 Tax=Neospora caninum (strain Liverpool) TaxID=572307 RepID=F0V8R4_NEOCL|nr:conserved hypothetical protein [Neospora caninum Liverpool]CBZ50105.1 conserved hypothetical protein [Neospora caninum Liverpool]CEL64700.1 TPA: hypothetical protein BN1204_005810 [Neospora caninum Liverpool]|eukprot:XP_003880140.1 conserved hypothetical protein [Neospora caninum Liverpool]